MFMTTKQRTQVDNQLRSWSVTQLFLIVSVWPLSLNAAKLSPSKPITELSNNPPSSPKPTC